MGFFQSDDRVSRGDGQNLFSVAAGDLTTGQRDLFDQRGTFMVSEGREGYHVSGCLLERDHGAGM
jgi:hypothetical protein